VLNFSILHCKRQLHRDPAVCVRTHEKDTLRASIHAAHGLPSQNALNPKAHQNQCEPRPCTSKADTNRCPFHVAKQLRAGEVSKVKKDSVLFYVAYDDVCLQRGRGGREFGCERNTRKMAALLTKAKTNNNMLKLKNPWNESNLRASKTSVSPHLFSSRLSF
jgi:hypothetical protein